MIFSRKKKPELIFRTSFEVTPEIAPRYVSQSKPSWFSNMSNDSTGSTTIKRCPGFALFFQRSILVPSWTDVAVKYYEDGNFSARVPNPWPEGDGITSHSSQQYPGAFEQYDNLKLTDYWTLEGTKGLDVMVVPVMPPNSEWEAAMGAWEPHADKHHVFNVNLWLKRPPLGQGWEYTIKRGDPLCYIVPLTETLPKITAKVESDPSYWRRIGFVGEFDVTAEYLKHKTKLKR